VTDRKEVREAAVEEEKLMIFFGGMKI